MKIQYNLDIEFLLDNLLMIIIYKNYPNFLNYKFYNIKRALNTMSKKPSSRTPTRTPKAAPKASSTKVSFSQIKIS
jgi:hypothetical protein